ncbi:hypothetical protein Trydic_g1300 [Trypoxylus dichotomus]
MNNNTAKSCACKIPCECDKNQVEEIEMPKAQSKNPRTPKVCWTIRNRTVTHLHNVSEKKVTEFSRTKLPPLRKKIMPPNEY